MLVDAPDRIPFSGADNHSKMYRCTIISGYQIHHKKRQENIMAGSLKRRRGRCFYPQFAIENRVKEVVLFFERACPTPPNPIFSKILFSGLDCISNHTNIPY